MKLLSIVLLTAPACAAAASCGDLAKVALPDAAITSAQSVPPGAFTPPEGPAIPSVPAFCRVTLVAKPSSDSNIRVEIWLPNENWNGKFQGVGNGGFAGSIGYGAMGAAIAGGYATAATDTGHQAGGVDAGWALGHHEKIVDWGHRAIHETAEKAKVLIHAFYGESPKRSYFNSCSNGGRQALMEAQRYPADYDGIIAGAPANYWTPLLTEALVNVQATLADPASYIPAAKLPAIEAAALAACDAGDGVKDGVIEDPSQCRFDPSVMLCKDTESDACLTQPQLTALKQLYAGFRDSKGKQIMPGYSPGGEAEPGGWAAWITGAAPGKSAMYAFGTQFFSNMVFDNASWDWKTFQADRDFKVADDKTAAILNAGDPDLKKFQARGGKLILYHGWSDAAIPGQSTVNYYRSVEKRMGAKQTTQFVRLYMVPGMEHCGGGASPNFFGQAGVPTADAQHDIDAALERWVEQGVAPAEIIASKFKTNMNPASGVVRTRPLCPYPQTAHYKGEGSTDDAANFVCK
jgi:feruloyl esterase